MATITATSTNNWATAFPSVPTAADDVVIPSPYTVTIPNGYAAVCRSFTVQSGGGITIANTSTATLAIGDGTAGAGNVAINISSGATVSLSAAYGAWSLVSTSATQQTITTGGKTMPSLTINGAGSSYILGDALIMDTATANTLTVTNGTFDTGNYNITGNIFNTATGTKTITLGSSAISLARNGGALSWATTNLTITANTAVFTFTQSATVATGSVDFNGASFVFTGAGTKTVTGAATVKDFTVTGTAAQTNIVSFGANVTCTGTFTVTGNSAINRPLIASSTLGTTRTITAATTSLTNVDFMDITGAGAASWAITSGVIGDWQGNSGITFTTPATQTRDSTSGSAWSVAARWTSRVPLPQDDVVINSSSGNISSTDVLVLGKNIDFSGYTGTLTHTSQSTDYSVFGSLTLGSGMSYGSAANTFYFDFRGRGTHTITSNGKTMPPFSSNGGNYIYAPGGSYTLADAFSFNVVSGIGNCFFTVSAGTFDSAGYSMTVGRFVSTGTLTRSVTLGSSVVSLYCTTATSMIAISGSGLSLSALSATFTITQTSASTRTVDLSGNWIGTVNYILSGSTGTLSIPTAGIISTLNFYDATNARTLQITTGITLTCFTFNVYGASGRLVTVQSSTTAVAFLSSPLQLYNASQDYITYSYMQVNQPLSLWCNTNSTASNSPSILASAPTYKHQQTASAYTASGTSVAPTFILSPTVGSLLVAYFSSASSQGTYTPPAGWTQAVTNSTNAIVYIYYKIADGTETTVTFSQTTARILYAQVTEYTGFSGTPTLDVTDNNGAGTSVTTLSTTATAGPTNTAQPALAVSMLAAPSTLAATTGLTNSFIEDRTLTNTVSNFKGAVKELTTTAAVETTYSWTTGRSGTAVGLAVFKNVSGSTGNFFQFF